MTCRRHDSIINAMTEGTIAEWLAEYGQTAGQARMRRLQRAAVTVKAGRIAPGPVRIMDREDWERVLERAGGQR